MDRVLFIPIRLSDHRMWAGIPDRLAGRAEVSHLDQITDATWDVSGAVSLAAARAVQPDGWDVVAAAGNSGPPAVALAAAGLARGIMLIEPEIPFDRIPDDVDLNLDVPDHDVLAPYVPLADALDTADPDQWRDIVADTVLQTSPAGVPPAELQLALAIAVDHAAEMRAELQAFAAANAAERELPDEAQWARLQARGEWLDRLAALSVPVVAAVPYRARYLAQTLASIVERARTVIIDTTIGPPSTPATRDQTATEISRLLDDISAARQQGAR
ncbi:MAG: hypothetical protein J2P27_11590 [Actinobacteria bacterium]|nr:hypothetical protein [Actinomycetota bacterium]